jgi:hypothetical protein
MAGTAGLEPATSRFVGGCSVQLSYVSIDKMVPRVGFEPTSPALQAGAFTRLASQALSQESYAVRANHNRAEDISSGISRGNNIRIDRCAAQRGSRS